MIPRRLSPLGGDRYSARQVLLTVRRLPTGARWCAAVQGDLTQEAAPGSQRLTPLRVARRPLLASLAGGRGATQVPACLTLRVSLRHAPLWHSSSASLPRSATLCMSKGSPLCAGVWVSRSGWVGRGSGVAERRAPRRPSCRGALGTLQRGHERLSALGAPAASEVLIWRSLRHSEALAGWISAPVISVWKASPAGSGPPCL